MIQLPQMQQYPAPAGASAVNIQIFEPKAYATPQGVQGSMPQQLDAQLYNYPQASVYNSPQQMGYVPYQTNAYQMPVQQQMPQPVLQQQPDVAPVQETPAPQEQAAPSQTVDLAAINNGLKSQDVNAQAETITKVAQLSQSSPDVALQVVDNEVMQNLLGIISQDTSKLEGPNQQQIAVAQKLKEGKELTPEEKAVAEQSSPREAAEKNKVFSMFTLAMLQKLQRDEIDSYNAQSSQSQVPPIKIEDLTGFNEIVNTIKTSEIPAVKVAGIQALSYVARPEDKAALEAALLPLQSDPDASVQQAAKETLAKLQTTSV